MKPVFLPRPATECFATPGTRTTFAAVSTWQTELQQTTRQWLRAGGSIEKWFEDYRRLRLDILHQNWRLIVPCDLRSKATFVLLGASARGEDTLTSDLDYALLLSTQTPSDIDNLQPHLYRFSQAMATFGVSPCPGNVMATNPRWIGTTETWKERIDAYFQYPSWENTRYLFMLVDSLPINLEKFGDPSASPNESAEIGVWNQLRQDVFDRISHSSYLCWEMAHLGIEIPPAAAGRTGGWLSSKRFGQRPKSISMKTSLINPIVHSLRLLAITHNISSLSTLDRLDALAAKQVLDRTLRQGVAQSLRWSWQARLHGGLTTPPNSANSGEFMLSSTANVHREELMTHLHTTRNLVRMVHRNFKKPR
ncbi:DUF294 nucleotidyltransferase-like domain-containing protein [Alicyclobacillus sp. SO9]|uniref:DUF294 nucleotidyltransferase-like domain-containing protein n=1 Tax=Alicyclobacillus sp. SO9 TaxID=2665646 RepID=UPI0018E7CD3E|nr:DUF294 nucleotidyltransferase-like domain-containing protein [Alicyclobacillus sp. SO9]QQE79842.1 hypothetical protein GI364_04975 [Alicyclobacillus sp. SO9]